MDSEVKRVLEEELGYDLSSSYFQDDDLLDLIDDVIRATKLAYGIY